jgi:peptidoglycan DL-endopeptidase CwlO
MLTRPRGLLVRLGTVLVAAVAFVLAGTTVAAATPGPGNEGGSATLRQQLEAAAKGFIEAQAALDNSIKRQAELTQQMADTEAKHATLSEDAATIAVAAYRSGGLLTASALLESGSPDSFFDRATTLNVISRGNDRNLHELDRLRKKLVEDKAAIDTEVATQQQQRDIMAKKKTDAEKAINTANRGSVNAGSASARPAPRNANGTWPPENCTVREPDKTRGCVTPRMAHLVAQAKAAGYGRYRACWREANDGGEHPIGKAGARRTTAVSTRSARPATSPPRRAASAAWRPAATRRTATSSPAG